MHNVYVHTCRLVSQLRWLFNKKYTRTISLSAVICVNNRIFNWN